MHQEDHPEDRQEDRQAATFQGGGRVEVGMGHDLAGKEEHPVRSLA